METPIETPTPAPPPPPRAAEAAMTFASILDVLVDWMSTLPVVPPVVLIVLLSM